MHKMNVGLAVFRCRDTTVSITADMESITCDVMRAQMHRLHALQHYNCGRERCNV
jgi:hypothetical protein